MRLTGWLIILGLVQIHTDPNYRNELIIPILPVVVMRLAVNYISRTRIINAFQGAKRLNQICCKWPNILLWLLQRTKHNLTWKKNSRQPSQLAFPIATLSPPQTKNICELMFCPDRATLQKFLHFVSSVWTFNPSFFLFPSFFLSSFLYLSLALPLSWVGMSHVEMLLPSAQRWVRGKGGEGP